MTVTRNPPTARALDDAAEESFTDDRTDATVWRMTETEGSSHALYFIHPSWTADCETLLFASDRSGSFQLYGMDVRSGETRRLTDHRDLDGFSAAPSAEENAVYYSAERSVWRLDVDAAEATRLHEFDAQPAGCDLSASEAGVVTATEGDDDSHIWWVNADGSGARKVATVDHTAFHLQCCPYDEDLILYANGLDARMWVIRSDGSDHRHLYSHDWETWLTHETWLGETGEIVFVHWPEALYAVDVETEAVRTIDDSGNVWHASVGSGNRIVADTNHPDEGIVQIDPETGDRAAVCESNSSNSGSQWGESVPARDEHAKGIVEQDTYGPQWTHPHPALDPSGEWITFTSDRTGSSEVYVVGAGSAPAG